ncbi:hypothetical protein M413DRAFT_442723 [Hebeloma cylindrosporum]|uniref:Phosphatidate phosphatase APP1 catalytic domain-containing protein n=1 Tax=Hebeloma cylindrosporum TaxID=76867 RepID=A0A0C3C7C9_HEBCY|nr:hypothetical protein M413DRAFT_442723 [Hebeloma cylindrosporum h7]
MSEDMSSSWRYITSAGSSLKGYLARDSGSGSRSRIPLAPNDHPNEERQSWRTWAGQKIRVRRSGKQVPGRENTELVNMFPGWAARRYAQEITAQGPSTFELEVFVSGYAISYRSPENASRSQRAFIRLAKGFASLPKIVENAADVLPYTSSLARLSPSTEALLANVKLPPRPVEITDDYDVDALERQLRRAKYIPDDQASFSDTSSPSSRSSTPDIANVGSSNIIGVNAGTISNILQGNGEVIRQLHANLEKRLQPFWSSVIPNRTVRLHLFATPHRDHLEQGEESEEDISFDGDNGPLVSQDVFTAVDGSFQAKFRINWEELCRHPQALHIAFGEEIEEHELLIVAQLLPPADAHRPSRSNSPTSLMQTPTPVPLTSLTRIPITHSPIRVISDIDDTVKFSGILSGARAVFRNVFVKDLRDSVIPGMGEWNAGMWSRGVRFHYVSNGPFELLPVLNEFFEISQLPHGSIKLKSYAGRSLFNGLLSAPAARKRAGIVDVLDSFPDSKFFLIGDSGEQDLELYADLARERPDSILGVFIRDADDATLEPLDDPTGWHAMGAAGTRPSERPLVGRSESNMTTQSTSSTPSFSKYNYASASSIDQDNASQAPQISEYSLKSTVAAVGVQEQSRNGIFGDGPLSVEPETLQTFADDQMKTPTPASSARMSSSVIDPPASRPHPLSNSSPMISPSSANVTNQQPKPTPPPSLTAASLYSQPTTSSSSHASNGKQASLSDAEKRRVQLQLRVYRARTQMPSHIPLRVFREAAECVEAQEILDRNT